VNVFDGLSVFRRAAGLKPLLLGLLCGLLLIVTRVSPIIADGGPQPVRINAATREQRGRVANLVAIEEVGKGYVVAIATSREIDQLRQLGYTVEPLPRLLDFPPEDSDYHNFAETVAELNGAVADHGNIVDLFSIGQTWEGRDLWMMKISDNPQVDEDEPEVFYVCHHHAREHLTVEMCLAIIEYFTDNYGLLSRVTQLVDTREIYVLTDANPDGGEYDVASGNYRWWRKNRRYNGDGTYGVDTNRNYDYAWGGTGSSGSTSSEIYRGPYAFSEPETQALRDFVNDHPDISVAISFHTYSELILWPYGYTYADVPLDMDPIDHEVFVTLGQAMAQTNGYTPLQASDLYPASGVWDDWMYGVHRIFAFTFEMYPPSYLPTFYPDDSVIPAETARNIEAVLMLAEVADDPYQVLVDAPTPTPTATFTPSSTATSTATATSTPSPTSTATATSTPSPTSTATHTATATQTATPSSTATQTATATATPRSCPMQEDFNTDNIISVEDIVRVLEHWGRDVADAPALLTSFDLDNSGRIDVVDIMLVARVWGDQCV